MDKQYSGKLTISRVRSNQDEGHVRIRIDDAASGCGACHVEVPLMSFAEALMNMSDQPCSFGLNLSGVVGKRRELRNITVPRPTERAGKRYDSEAGRKWIEKHAAAELVDGWEPHSPAEVFNSHRWTGKNEVNVTLIRFV